MIELSRPPPRFRVLWQDPGVEGYLERSMTEGCATCIAPDV